MVSCPYPDLIGTQSPVYTDTFLETLVVLVKRTEEGFILRTDALIGVAHHVSRDKRLPVRKTLIVLDDLSLDIIQ